MECERKSKVRKLREKQQIHEPMLESEMNLTDLPREMLEQVARFVPRKQLINFGLTNKKCHQIFHQIYYKNLDLRNCLRVDKKKMFQVVKNINYISLNLNECHWLSSEVVLELVSKESVRELNLIDCECTPEVIEQIAKLSLISLSISLNKYWIDFFESNEINSIPCLKGLKKLTILHSNCKPSGFLISHVSQHVISHCPNLIYLKLATYPSQNSNFSDRFLSDETFRAENISTPVPELETLILDVESEQNISQDVFNLVELILNGKEAPLKRIYLGKYTAQAISSGIFCSKNLSFERTRTLCISSILEEDSDSVQSFPDFLSVPGFESAVDSMLKAPSCKRLEMENLSLKKFELIAEKIIKSGNTSIEEISLRGCYINGSKFIRKSLFKISNFCPQINFLDLSNTMWYSFGNVNSKLMECLSNLTNLRTLYLMPDMLFCTTNIAKRHLKSSFRKLAENCKLIEKFGIVNISLHSVTAQDVLSQVKFFENLQELHLVNIITTGTELALPEIAQSCARLTHLYIRNVYNLELRTRQLPWEHIFVHTKQLKHFSLMDNDSVRITKKLVDGLVECSQLEKLCVSPILGDPVDEIQYFADNLRKLTKLEVFVIKSSAQVVANFRSAINEIEETKKPSFYGYTTYLNRTVLPLAHRHLLQYESYE